ncbi:MAG: glycosyltransferase [Elainella sp.]
MAATRMSFPDDRHWLEICAFLEQHLQSADRLLAPIDFLTRFPVQSYPYNIAVTLPVEHFTFVALHKGMLAEVDLGFLLQVLAQLQPVLANPVFVLYADPAATSRFLDLPAPDPAEVEPLEAQMQAQMQPPTQTPTSSNSQPIQRCALVVTTHNQSAVLAQTLPALTQLGAPLLLVDNGSTASQAAANRALAEQYGAALLYLPEHLLLSAAINAGVSYWLAHPAVEWISCFQDNVRVQPDLLQQLLRIQDPEHYPLLTGYDAPEHEGQETELGGQRVRLKLATSGVHLHAHRRYWQAVLPVPTLYDPAQLKPGQGSDADWWITAWSPNAVIRRGGHVVCVPQLVACFEPSQFAQPLGQSLDQALGSAPASGQSAKLSPAFSGLDLAGVKVLVDGYNLQLTKGTGIKTYGLSLIEALNQLGARVDVLLSRGGYKSNEILDEIFFFDNQSPKQDLLTISKWIVKSLSPFYRAKRRKSFAGLVVKRGQYSDDFLKYATSFNLPQCYDLANGLYNKLRWKTDISVAEKVDIWHATYPLPMQVRGARKITTVHDLIPFRLPYATLDDKKVFYFKTRDALKDSAVTITVSENSKQDLLTYYDADPDKIVVTYQPIALKPLPDSDQEVAFFLRRFGLEFQNYLLFVGAIEPKKNVGRLLDAYASMDVDLPLVIVGKKGWLWEDELGKTGLIDNKTSRKTVKLLEYVAVDSLRYLYRGAFCLVFPSLYEGFGLPPLEAMNFGCPVITSNVSCLPEICGSAALYVDPYSVRDIKEKVETLLADPALRQRLVQNGKVNAQLFSPENYTKRLHQAYVKALS